MPKARHNLKHKFAVSADVRIVKDLSGESPEMVGREAQIKEWLPGGRYKVLIFGGNGVIGGIFEADEEELGTQF